MDFTESFFPFGDEQGMDNNTFGSEFGAESQSEDPFELNEDKKKYYSNEFKAYDTNFDGYISREEALQYLSQSNLPTQEFDTLFSLCDVDMDNYLSEDEFVSFAHISSVCQNGIPLPTELPVSLQNLKSNTSNAESSFFDFMDDSHIPSGEEAVSAVNPFDLPTTMDSHPIPRAHGIFSESEEEPEPEPEEPIDTNPFSAGLDEYLQQEQEELEKLKDANEVPAVVCENREKLHDQWLSNMKKWKGVESTLRAKEEEIERKKSENEDLREKIAMLQKRLGTYQENVQSKLTRISALQASLNNHLIKNKIDQPIRVAYDQPDLFDLFTPPEDTAKLSSPLSPRQLYNSTTPLSYEALEQDQSLLSPDGSLAILGSPRHSVLSDGDKEEPVAVKTQHKAFARSKKARSFLTREEVQQASSDSSDEDLKPVMQSSFSAFRGKRATAENSIGGSRWYRGVYEEKRKLDNEYEEALRLEREEEKRREEEERKEKARRAKEEEELFGSESDEGVEEEEEEELFGSDEEKEKKGAVFMMSDEEEVFSDDDLPVEHESKEELDEEEIKEEAKEEIKEEAKEEIKEEIKEEPKEVKPDDEFIDDFADEEETPKKEEKKEAKEEPDDEFIDDFADEEPKEEKKEEKKEEHDDEFIDDFADEEETPKKEEKETPDNDEEFIDDFADEEETPKKEETPKESERSPEDDEFIDDFDDADETPKEGDETPEVEEKPNDEEKKEDAPKKKEGKDKKKKDKKKKEEKPKEEPEGEKKERRGRRGKKENGEKKEEGFLGALGKPKPKTKKNKKPAAK